MQSTAGRSQDSFEEDHQALINKFVYQNRSRANLRLTRSKVNNPNQSSEKKQSRAMAALQSSDLRMQMSRNYNSYLKPASSSQKAIDKIGAKRLKE